MQISTVKYENFMCFEQAEIDLAAPGLTAIEGRIGDTAGCDSNGSGKSSIMDGVSWCLYGRCLREKYKGDDIRRETAKPKEGTVVEVNIIGGPKPITVRRYRKHPLQQNNVRLLIGGKDVSRGTNPETDLAIVEALGMDFTMFANSVAFGAREDVRSFFASTDTERKKVLDRMLGLELYAEAEKVARRRLKTVAATMDEHARKRDRIQAAIETLQGQFGTVPTPEELEREELDVAKQRALCALLMRRKVKADARLAVAKKDLSLAEEQFAGIWAEYEAHCDEREKNLAKLRRDARSYESDLSGKTADRSRLEQRITRLEKLDKAVCPTCEQPVKAKHLKGMMQPLIDERDALTEEVLATKDLRDAADKAIREVEDAEVEVPTSLEVETFTQEIEIEEAEVNDYARKYEVAHARLSEMEAAAEEHTTAAAALSAEIDSKSKDLAEVEAEYAKHERKAAQLEFWADGFGKSGLRSFLTEAEIPEINRRASAFAWRLLGEGAYVKLSATRQLKSGKGQREELSITARIPNKTKTYAGASKGQKKRLDLCLLLAFRELVAARAAKPFNQLFADEIFDGLDRSGSDAVVSLLKETAAVCPVLLVTHSEYIKSAGDQLVVVEHDGTTARIISGDSGRKGDTTKKSPTKRKRRRSA